MVWVLIGREAHRRQTIRTCEYAHISGIASPVPLQNKAALFRFFCFHLPHSTPAAGCEIPMRDPMIVRFALRVWDFVVKMARFVAENWELPFMR